MSNAAPSLIVEALMDADRRNNLTPLALRLLINVPSSEESGFILDFLDRTDFQDRDGQAVDKSAIISKVKAARIPWSDKLRRELVDWLSPLCIVRGRGGRENPAYMPTAEDVMAAAKKEFQRLRAEGEKREPAIATAAEKFNVNSKSLRNALDGKRRSDARKSPALNGDSMPVLHPHRPH